jgi:predicted RecA/RadA family phage recombinase
MAQATFRKAGDSIDYTPGSAVAAGDVVVQGELVGIAPRAIAANELGALTVEGVIDVVKINSQITAGAKVYWDADGNPHNGTAGSGAATTSTDTGTNKLIGKAIATAAAGDETVRVKLSQ